jgi:hypothetical protein
MNGESGRGCLVVLFKLHAPLKYRSTILEIDAAAVLFPIAETSGFKAAATTDFLAFGLRGRFSCITLLIDLMGHFGVLNGRLSGSLAGRHGGVVCQKPYVRGTPRISQVTMGNFGFSE